MVCRCPSPAGLVSRVGRPIFPPTDVGMTAVGMTAVTLPPTATHPGRRIVVTTWGSLGDLHPYIALGLSLQARGHDVIVGTAECYRRKIEAWGLGSRAIRPIALAGGPRHAAAALAPPLGPDPRCTHGAFRAARIVRGHARGGRGADLLVGNLATLCRRPGGGGEEGNPLGLPHASPRSSSSPTIGRCSSPPSSQRTTTRRSSITCGHVSGLRYNYVLLTLSISNRSGLGLPKAPRILTSSAISPALTLNPTSSVHTSQSHHFQYSSSSCQS